VTGRRFADTPGARAASPWADNARMDHPTDEHLTEFVERAEEAADAWVRGDVDRYLDLVHHARGFTLLQPTGGPAGRHEDRHGELRGWESSFAGGEATLEHVMTHAWGDTVVLVMIERQHGRIGDQPDQDLSLRVTHVYRRDGAGWLLVHRHADPLVATLSPGELAALLSR
jgi:ketosteroid isomerase-like protein